MSGGATVPGRSVTSKVTAILMVFSRGGEYSLTELARLTGIPVSTAHRLAGELTARRLLERTDDGGYRIGLPLRMIGTSTVSGRGAGPALLERAADVMADLAVATGRPVRLGMLDGARLAFSHGGEEGLAPSGFVASPTPAHATAAGRVLLAFSPAAVVDQIMAGELGSGGSPAICENLRRMLRSTRLTRFAVARGHGPAGAIAMPVFGAGGRVLAALELSITDIRVDLVGVRAALVVATGSLSRQLATEASPAAATGFGAGTRTSGSPAAAAG